MTQVDVTAEDIRRGVRTDCTFCPVARALRRAGYLNAVATGFGCSFLQHGHVVRTNLPDTAVAFIRSFDHGLHVYPFSFGMTVDP